MIAMKLNKTAVVTGGGTGIGKGIALSLIDNGFDVVVTYHSSSTGADEVVEYAKSKGRIAYGVKADISKVEQINEMFAQIKAYFDHLDLFVNNAGVTMKSEFLETDEATFDAICDIDNKGSYFCMQAAAKFMVETDTKGSIIVISSNNAIAHFAGVSVYGSAKAALNKLTEHVAIELAKYGIRVNTISPGWTDTGAARLDAKQDTYYKIPLKKWTTPQEIADAVLYLSSDSAVSITGANLVIDNGALLLSDKGENYGL